MQLLVSQCPYCQASVETTLEKIDEPIACPQCGKPFEMEIPTAEVRGIRDVADGTPAAVETRAEQAPERTLLKVHPAIFRSRPILFIGLLALIGAGLYGGWYGWTTSQSFVLYSSLAVAALGVLGLLVWWMRAIFVTLTVTTSRTILQRGFISRAVTEVQHNDVRNIQLQQTFLERMFGIGNLGISSAGQSNIEIVARHIGNPGRIVELIRANQR